MGHTLKTMGTRTRVIGSEDSGMEKAERVMEAGQWTGSGETCMKGASRTMSSEWIRYHESDSHIFLEGMLIHIILIALPLFIGMVLGP